MVTKKSNSRIFSVLFIIAMLVGVVAFPYTVRAAGILYVTPSGAGNCASWANACGLQTALTTAVSGDEIWVAAGTYKPTTGTDRAVSFVLKNGVAVYGGFAGTETLRTQRNSAANVTILSGDIDNNDSQTPIITNLTTITGNTTNSYDVVDGSGTDNTAILDGFTVTGGNANTYPREWGGGMYNDSGSPALADVIFIGNNASQHGGGMYNVASNPLLTDVTFSGNNASQEGGGIYNYHSNPLLTNVTFNSNTAGNSGGGMYSDGSSPLLMNSTFSNNTAGISGGAMLNNLGSIPTLTNVTFSGNSAPNGGGIQNRYASNPTLTHVTFSANVASLLGGGMYNYQSSPILTDVVFSNNTATSIYGGGMYNEYGSSPNLTNVTFSGNSAFRGGGIYNHSDCNPQLMNVTFNGNNALNEGGGIYNSSSILMITNSLFDQNHAATDGGAVYNGIGDVAILNSTFSRNGALNEGGSIFNSTTFIGKMTVTNSTFFGNDASNNGGGILNLGPMTITNSTLSENTAGINGGGLNNADGTVTIVNSTFSGNSAITAGGGIRNDGTMSYTNTIVANSTSGGDCSNFWTISTNTNNLVEDGSCSAMLNGDPKLGPLANNGGVTKTMALSAESLAVNAGTDTGCPATDQRGVTRPQGSHCDIGAYEFDPAPIKVYIGSNLQGSYLLGPGESTRQNYVGVDSGPVKVVSTDGTPIVSAIREAWAVNGVTTSFFQLMGLPQEQLSDTYVFPGYNNVTLNEQLRISNVDTVASTVTVTIGGVLRGTYPLAAGEAVRINYAGLDSGPVIVQGTTGVKIISAIREAWAVGGVTKSFVQLMGLPKQQLSDKYVFPGYNNVTLNEQLRIGNVDTVASTVTVTIGGVLRGTYILQPNEAVRVNYAGVDSGPVIVQGTTGVKIISAIREAWAVNGVTTSFAQLMGLPSGQLSNKYVFPGYNNVTLNDQLRIGNVDNVQTTVTVTIGGVLRGTYTLQPNEAVRVNYAGLDSGPVVVEGSVGVKIISAIREAWAVNGVTTSFTQLMGLPFEQLSSTFWFPAYNNVTLNEQLRIAVP